MLEADYIFAHVLLGTGDPGKMRRALNEILRYQNEDGGWAIYPGGPSNISLSVKCYLAGKLMGMTRRRILRWLKHGTWILAQWRRGGMQHLHQDLPVFDRAVRLRRGACDSSRDRSLPELVLLQHLRDFVVVAGDPGSAVDPSTRRSRSRSSRRSRGSMSCLWAAARKADLRLELRPEERW